MKKWSLKLTVKNLTGFSLHRFKSVVLKSLSLQFQQRSWRLARALGSLCARWLKRGASPDLFFFFSDWGVGGAERVHATIVEAVADLRPWVIFTGRDFSGTRLTRKESFSSLFREHATAWDVSPYPLYSLRGQFVWGLVASIINRQAHPTVFGCSSRHFYKLLPYLNEKVRRIDMLHNFGGQFEHISLPYVSLLDKRLAISEPLREELKHLYAKNSIASSCQDRIVVIENGINVPAIVTRKGEGTVLHVLYVGRGSKQKRVHLIGQVASACHALNTAADFTLVGDVFEAVDARDRTSCIFAGTLADEKAVNRFYDKADLLLLTSFYEGFPLVIMEAMAHGVVPICTNVGAISTHARHMINSILVSPEDEPHVVKTMVAAIRELEQNRDRLRALSLAARRHAEACFRRERCRQQYRQLFLSD